jgi:ribosomal protein S27E
MPPTKDEPWTVFDPKDKRDKPTHGNPDNWVECPKCKGHTLCVMDSTTNFKVACGQCGGMFPVGWVLKDSPDATCIHDFQYSRLISNCFHEYKCSKCGKTQQIDSGG